MPWMLIAAVPLAVASALLKPSPALLLCLALTVLLAAIALPTVMVVWQQWLIEGRNPAKPIALPSRRTWSCLWRIWIFGSLVLRTANSVDQPVSRWAVSMHWPAPEAIGSGANLLVTVLGFALFSQFALQLPALAVKDEAFGQSEALAAGRKLSPQFALGFVISLGPFLIANIGLTFLSEVMWKGPTAPPWQTALYFEVIALAYVVCGITVGTYLARAYQHAKTTR